MTVFTQNNQTGIRLNARPASFMITDILAANNTTISPSVAAASQTSLATGSPTASPPLAPQTTATTDPVPAMSPEQQYHLYQQQQQHFLHQQQQHQQHFYQQQQHHQHHLYQHAHLQGGAMPSAAAGLQMRVPSAGLSPVDPEHSGEFDCSDNENEEEDGDSSVCSNGTKDGRSSSVDAADAAGGKSPSSRSSSSHPLSGMRPSSKKQRKARTAFSDHQLHSLEKSFTRQKYLSVQDRMELAAKLGISDTQVKTWFQNRRTKWKRQTSVGFELLVEAGNYAAYQRAAAFRSSYPPPHGTGLDGSYLPPVGAFSGGQPGAAPTAAEMYYRHQHQQQMAAVMAQQQHQHQQHSMGSHLQAGGHPAAQHPAYSMYAAAAAAAAAAMKTGVPFPYQQQQPQPQSQAPPAPNSSASAQQLPPLPRPTAQLPLSLMMNQLAQSAAAMAASADASRRSTASLCSPHGSHHSADETPTAAVVAPVRESSATPPANALAQTTTVHADDVAAPPPPTSEGDDDEDESDIEV